MLKQQPFGLTLNPNSEVVLAYSLLSGMVSTSVFRRNIFRFLQSNLPIVYELIHGKIYIPLVLEEADGLDLFGKMKLHLIKIDHRNVLSEDSGEYIDFVYSNLSHRLRFVESSNFESIRKRLIVDEFTKEVFSVLSFNSIQMCPNETIKIRVKSEWAKYYYRKYKWRIRFNLLKIKYFQ